MDTSALEFTALVNFAPCIKSPSHRGHSSRRATARQLDKYHVDIFPRGSETKRRDRRRSSRRNLDVTAMLAILSRGYDPFALRVRTSGSRIESEAGPRFRDFRVLIWQGLRAACILSRS